MTQQLDLIAGLARRDEGVQRVTVASDDQDVAVVDQAIREVAARGLPFSSHDIRPLLPELRELNLIGARFRAAKGRGEIEWLGYQRCHTPSAHGRPVGIWQAV